VKHDIYDVYFRKVTVTIAGQAVAVRGWMRSDFVAVTAGEGWGWKVHRFAPIGSGVASHELVRGLDRDAAIAIVHDASKIAAVRQEAFQGVLRKHLGSFAL